MNSETAGELIRLNAQFYQTFASQFSSTRQRLQPGVRHILAQIPAGVNILDLGCGNGGLARTLTHEGHQGIYLGVDFSTDLLEYARQNPETDQNVFFRQIDLTHPDWAAPVREVIQRFDARHDGFERFDVIFAFAVLHHLPGMDLRLQMLNQVRQLIQPGGQFVHSVWQFLNSPRLRERIVDWERAEISSVNLDPGDYLMDWRQGGYGLRYVHHFSGEELVQLAEQAGFRIKQDFLSDGENNRLGLYQVWDPI
jgi:tRNA (uracil-5-)-methyltransferase TRM9